MPQQRKINQVNHYLPYSFELLQARFTVDTKPTLAKKEEAVKAREKAIIALYLCGDDILHLQRDYNVLADAFPDDFVAYLWLTEEDYLQNYSIEQLGDASSYLNGVIYEIRERLDIVDVEFEGYVHPVPAPVWEAILKLPNKDKRTYIQELASDNLYRVSWLAEVAPYPDDDGKTVRPMEDFITLATGLTGFENPDMPLRINKKGVFPPLLEEFGANREFQKLVDTYLQDTYRCSFPFDLFKRTFPDSEPHI